jgi:hypothetical protein
MAITVDWSSQPYLITFSQSDLTFIGGTRYEITANKMWELLRDFSDSPEGFPFPITYRRIPATAATPPITEINDPAYAAQFQDGAYSVDIINGNTNFRDVEVKNTVSVGTNNTTGFVDIASDQLTLIERILRNKSVTDPVTGIQTWYDTDGTTPLLTAQLYEGTGTGQTYRGQGAERRERVT